MNPATILILEYGLKYGPIAAELVQGLFRSFKEGNEPKDEEWQALWSIMKEQEAQSYKDRVPHSQLPDPE